MKPTHTRLTYTRIPATRRVNNQHLHTQNVTTRRRCGRNDNQDSPRGLSAHRANGIAADQAESKVASATAPLRTGADMCRTGAGAGSSAGADKGPDRRQSNHDWTDDQARRRRLANTDSDGGSPVPMTPGRGVSEQAVFVVQ